MMAGAGTGIGSGASPQATGRERLYAITALKRMEAAGVAPTPVNYAVWYACCAGTNQELAREVEKLEASANGSASQQAERLHAQFLGDGAARAQVEAISAQVEETMRGLLDQVGAAGAGARTYGETLNHLSGELSAHQDGGGTAGLSAVIASVLSETNRMATINQQLESQLVKSTEEINRLRADLDEVRTEAATDALTQIANRKTFERELARMAAEAQSKPGFLSLLMLDIDFFKKFNDTYGHQTGDQVLKVVARTLSEVVDTLGLPARLGGEEFAVLLPDHALAKARALGEQIRKTMATKTLRNRKTNTDLGGLTLSIGVSEYVLGESFSGFIERADEALYLAKKSGRNQVRTQADLDR